MPRTKTKLVQPASGRNGPVTVRRVLDFSDLVPLAKAETLRIAKGDRGRISVISPTEAVVHNSPVTRARGRR